MQNDRNNTKPRQISRRTGGLSGPSVSSIPSPSITINLARILGSPSNIALPLQYPSTSKEMKKKMQFLRLEAKNLVEVGVLLNTLEHFKQVSTGHTRQSISLNSTIYTIDLSGSILYCSLLLFSRTLRAAAGLCFNIFEGGGVSETLPCENEINNQRVGNSVF